LAYLLQLAKATKYSGLKLNSFYTSKGGRLMKKIIFLLIIAVFLGGCTAEFYKHDTIYKSNDHMTFSWWGYKTPTDEDLTASEAEGWWGTEIPYIPAE